MNSSLNFAAKLDDVRPGNTKKICFPNHRPILLANVGGIIYAVDDTCTHEDSSLALGCLRDDKVKCTLHGSWFSVITGEPTEDPADEPLNRYKIEINDDEIWIDLSPIE
ncbi:MAG: non-heme iron oxygenase ferredoxin subunit [Gammaproteobacteria bacterium]|nr:non-heme iron oxygenase ferredoxin subunit [Gammaproteobacteria bacterium]